MRRAIDSELPKRIGRYEAFLQIGAGGMARVFLAGLRPPGKPPELVVIKQLRREVAEDASVHAMFLDEARIAMRLDHPNVVRTREVVAEAPNYFLAMEFLDGQALLEVNKRLEYKIPLPEHLYILTQVLAGLAYAHELKDNDGRPLGIVHRDVSPANVLVCYDGAVKIIDFGIAKANGAVAATQDGVVKGKLGYAAPEQCLGNPADPRSDIYSVGVMLWEAVAGRRRSSGETWQSVLQARIDDTDLALEQARPDAPPELIAIAKRALAREPDERFKSAREFQGALERYMSRLPHKVGAEALIPLMMPLFADDRAAVERAIELHLAPARGDRPSTARSGTMPKVPPPPSSRKKLEPVFALPPPVPPPPQNDLNEDLDIGDLGPEPEDTSPIPVDEALLIKSRRGSIPPRIGSAHPKSSPSAAPGPTKRPPPSGPRTDPSGLGDAHQRSVYEAKTMSPPSSTAAAVQVKSLRQDDVSRTPKKSPPWALIGGGVAAVAILGVVLLSRGAGAPSGAPVAAGSAAGSPVPVAVHDEPLAPPAAVAPAVGELKLRIAVKQDSARIRIDGRLMKGNPFVGVVKKDDKDHELTVTADNYHEYAETLRFDQDLDLELSLDSTKGPARPRAVRISRTGNPTAAAAPAIETTPKAAAATPKLEPGMDLDVRPSTPVKRSIDEKDPYAP